MFHKVPTVLLIALLAVSCELDKPIRSLSGVRKTYSSNTRFRDIDKLIESSLAVNRDIAGASIFYLGKYLQNLDKLRAEQKLKKEIEAEVNIKIAEIQSHLQKMFYVNADFNLRLLSLHAIGNIQNQDTLHFFSKILTEGNSGEILLVLEKIAEYFTEESIRQNKTNYDFTETLHALNSASQNAKAPVSYRIIQILKLFTDNPQASTILSQLPSRTFDPIALSILND